MKTYITVKHKDGSYFNEQGSASNISWRGLDSIFLLFDNPGSAQDVARYGDRVIQVSVTESQTYEEGQTFGEGEIARIVRE